MLQFAPELTPPMLAFMRLLFSFLAALCVAVMFSGSTTLAEPEVEHPISFKLLFVDETGKPIVDTDCDNVELKPVFYREYEGPWRFKSISSNVDSPTTDKNGVCETQLDEDFIYNWDCLIVPEYYRPELDGWELTDAITSAVKAKKTELLVKCLPYIECSLELTTLDV